MPIEISNLNYVYSPKTPFEKKALIDVCLSVEDGDFLGVIGHTGSGKSTLIGHLNGLTKIQSGSIVIGDMTLLPKKKPEYKRLRAHVGMVFQYPEYQLFDETVYKDVSFGPKNLGIKDDELTTRVREAIEMVGLSFDEVKERSPFELSGGQKRRVAIAGVLAMRPQILVLDEPTAGLDPRGKSEILALVRRIKSEMCPTVVLISHNMDEVAECCNKIAVMADGRLRCVLPPKKLFSQEQLLSELNIDMPQVTRIACMLGARGLDIDRSVITEDELLAEILRVKGKSDRA